jgi:hypothetical protein
MQWSDRKPRLGMPGRRLDRLSINGEARMLALSMSRLRAGRDSSLRDAERSKRGAKRSRPSSNDRGGLMKMRILALLPAALLLAACNRETPPPAAPETPAQPTPAPAAVAAGIKPVDIPAGFGYPGNRREFQQWADEWQIGNITTAAWNLWAGMTSDSGQTWNGSSLPIWETWCGNEEVFSVAGCDSLSRPPRGFQLASQVGHTARKAGQPMPSDGQVVSFNKFNPSMAQYLATAQAGPGGAQYTYTSMQDLANLNAAWPVETPIGARKVVDAPYTPDNGDTVGATGIETKPVIFVVKATGLTPIPLWQGTAQSSNKNNAAPQTWSVCVLVDPAGAPDPTTAPVPATPEQVSQAVASSGLTCDPKKYLYAPLSTIYSFKMDAAEAADWNALVASNGTGDTGQGLTAQDGDFGVLVAMHVNSKAIVNWTWETFWWQPGTDAPDNFPGSKQGMTDNVAGAWRNYAMCTAWNQTKGNGSKEMVVCFNPYLETSSGIPAGQTSNCMSCHGTATAGSPLSGTPLSLPTLNYPADYKTPIDFDNDPRYSTFTRTDFSWAIPSNAFIPAPPAGDAKK